MPVRTMVTLWPLFFGLTLIGLVLVQWCTAVVFGMGAVYAASGTIVMISGVVAICGPIMVAFGMQWWGLEAYFLMLAAALLLLAVVAIWRVLTVPALPPKYKTHSVIQAPATPVGSVLHPEEKEVA